MTTEVYKDNVYSLFEAESDGSQAPAAVFLTVEHASARIPEPWPAPSSSDAILLTQHWGIDLGAETLAHELASKLLGRVRGISANFSRLHCDANRNLDEDEQLEQEYRDGQRADPGTMMRRTVENGKVMVEMNKDLTLEDRRLRIDTLYRPYHAAVSAHLADLQRNCAASSTPILVFSIHSFTDEYEGRKRTLEAGVLYRDEQDRELAEKMVSDLSAAGFNSAVNEPWSGKEGFMHSANVHARELENGRALMIEARQDLLTSDPGWRARLVESVCQTIVDWHLEMAK
jgi:predicted N-formylglutamate amidohydrolase